MRILATALLRDYKLGTKLMGLTGNPRVERIDLVRRHPLGGLGPRELAKVRNINPEGVWRDAWPLYEAFRFRALGAQIRRERPDLLFGVYLMLHGMHIALAGRRAGVPYVLSLIGDDVQTYLRLPATRPLLAWTVRGAAAVTVMGPSSRDIVVAAGCAPERVFEIQNHQDCERFSPGPGPDAAEYDIVFVGDFIPRKGIDSILRAMAALRPRRKARAALVGDGPSLAGLQALARTLGLEDSVDFLGRRPDVEAVLRRSRVLVMPSSLEGLPAAAVEAMLCGLPVVLTDVGDVRALFRHGENALLAPHGDQPALDKALRDVLTDQALYDRLRAGALAARERFVEEWGLEGQVRAWDRILDTALRPS